MKYSCLMKKMLNINILENNNNIIMGVLNEKRCKENLTNDPKNYKV